jgi:hypothetical protein
MKVYTHFTKIDASKSEGFRWRTLLQFGDSWKVIGSVVMKNPGSAALKGNCPITQSNILSELSVFDNSDNDWYEFTEDNTMRCVAKLFAFKYGYSSVDQLNGIIQVFNLFYLREANLAKAISNGYRNVVSGEDDYKQLIAPVYLGFSQSLANNPEYKDRANRFFNKAIELGMNNIDKKSFTVNTFYHPQYLFFQGCGKPKSILELARFKENTVNPSQDAMERTISFCHAKESGETESVHNCSFEDACSVMTIVQSWAKDKQPNILTEEKKDWIKLHLNDNIVFQVVVQKGNQCIRLYVKELSTLPNNFLQNNRFSIPFKKGLTYVTDTKLTDLGNAKDIITNKVIELIKELI